MDTAAERRESWFAAAIAGFLILAMVAGIAAYGFHQACFDPGPPVERPEPASPRAEFCSAVEATDPWISLTLGPLLVFAVAALALSGRRPLWIGLFALALCLALLGVMAVANELRYYVTNI